MHDKAQRAANQLLCEALSRILEHAYFALHFAQLIFTLPRSFADDVIRGLSPRAIGRLHLGRSRLEYVSTSATKAEICP